MVRLEWILEVGCLRDGSEDFLQESIAVGRSAKEVLQIYASAQEGPRSYCKGLSHTLSESNSSLLPPQRRILSR